MFDLNPLKTEIIKKQIDEVMNENSAITCGECVFYCLMYIRYILTYAKGEKIGDEFYKLNTKFIEDNKK